MMLPCSIRRSTLHTGQGADWLRAGEGRGAGGSIVHEEADGRSTAWQCDTYTLTSLGAAPGPMAAAAAPSRIA